MCQINQKLAANKKITLGASVHAASSQSDSERWHLLNTAYLLAHEEWQFILITFL